MQRSFGTVGTQYGPLLNVTGVGPATVDFASRSLAFLLGTSPADRAFELTDRQGPPPNWTFAVWRGSLDPNTNMTVYGATHSSSGNLEVSVACGGPGYSGPVSEGWNHLRVLVGDCFGLVNSVPFLLPVLFFLAGGSALAVERRRNGPTA